MEEMPAAEELSVLMQTNLRSDSADRVELSAAAVSGLNDGFSNY